MDRRDFIETVANSSAILMAGVNVLSGCSYSLSVQEVVPISQVKKRLAIAMWDYSWILRHHRYGEFENWDKVLEELAERGYNAIRIDAMPQFIVSSADGKITDEYRSVRNWTPAMWGNDYTMSFRPREAILDFMSKCKKYNIQVGLATWFMNHGTGSKDIFMEEGGLFRAWDETLTFLNDHHMLDNVIYVDILNEYPNWHGYDWFLNEMKKRSDIRQFKLDNPDANLPDADDSSGMYTSLQKTFLNQFANDILLKLKKKYTELDFFASTDSGISEKLLDLTHFDALDYHIWFAHHENIPGLADVGAIDQAKFDYRSSMKELQLFYAANKKRLVSWMDGRMAEISQAAEKYGIICGNTEGWGPIFWFDHPELDWSWVKESGEVCIELLQAYPRYKFICTSNFTHPQFKGMWEDIKWHKEMTRKIRSVN